MTGEDLDWLRANRYSTEPVDTCYLDCSEEGHLKTWRSKEIVLCVPHARVLEAGKVGGSYNGAPLPAESVATEWPWRPAEAAPLPV